MMYKNLLVAIIALVCSLPACAQYTEIINSNRPGASEGAFAVGYEVIQIETGAWMGWEKHRLLNTESDIWSFDYAARSGLLMERLELSFIGNFMSESGEITGSAENHTFERRNFTFNTVGAKFLLYDPYKMRALEKPNLYSYHANNKFRWRELIPAVSIYLGMNIDGEDNPFLRPANNVELEYSFMSPKAMLITQHHFEGGFVLVTNVIYDRFLTELETFSYIVTLTHAVSKRFSIFVENQGINGDLYADQLGRFGAAWLATRDLQFDIQGMLNFKDTPSRYYVGLGASFRFDMHSEDEILRDPNEIPEMN